MLVFRGGLVAHWPSPGWCRPGRGCASYTGRRSVDRASTAPAPSWMKETSFRIVPGQKIKSRGHRGLKKKKRTASEPSRCKLRCWGLCGSCCTSRSILQDTWAGRTLLGAGHMNVITVIFACNKWQNAFKKRKMHTLVLATDGDERFHWWRGTALSHSPADRKRRKMTKTFHSSALESKF